MSDGQRFPERGVVSITYCMAVLGLIYCCAESWRALEREVVQPTECGCSGVVFSQLFLLFETLHV